MLAFVHLSISWQTLCSGSVPGPEDSKVEDVGLTNFEDLSEGHHMPFIRVYMVCVRSTTDMLGECTGRRGILPGELGMMSLKTWH